jgi:hypothetical protein
MWGEAGGHACCVPPLIPVLDSPSLSWYIFERNNKGVVVTPFSILFLKQADADRKLDR